MVAAPCPNSLFRPISLSFCSSEEGRKRERVMEFAVALTRATWCHVGERREMKFQRVPVRTQTERGEYLSYLQLQIPLLVPCPEKRLKVSK